MNTRLTLLLLIALALPGCASHLQTPLLLEEVAGQLPEAVMQPDLPFFAQNQYQCGPAALATVLVAAGIDTSPQALVPRVYVPGKTGSYQLELVTASRDAGRLAYPLQPTMHDLLQELAKGNPVLVMQNLGLSIAPQWHFAVAKGYDLERKQLILNSGEIENYRVSLLTFERTWARSNYWGLVILPPGELPVTAEPQRWFSALTDLEHNRPGSEEVMAYYHSAREAWPAYADLHMGFANLLYSQGNEDAALVEFRRLITAHPDYAPAFNNAAWILYERAEFTQALALADKALALGGDHRENYADTRAQILSAIADMALTE